MKRPLLNCIGAFIFGIFLSSKLLWIAIIAILFILCEIACYLSKKRERLKIIFILFLIVIFGYLYKFGFDCINLSNTEKHIGKTVRVEGIVNNEGEKKNTYWQYIIKDVCIEKKKIGSKVLLKSNKELEFGDKIRIKGVLIRPKGASNANCFDYFKYLKTLNVYTILEPVEISVENKDCTNFIEKIGHLTRKKVREFSEDTLKLKEVGILTALIVGDDTSLDGEIEESYKRAGMIHLLVVSGGHTVFLITLFNFILSIFEISKNTSKILCIFVIIIYIFITGCTASILRAGIGIIIVIMSKLIGRQNDGFTTLGIVAFIILIINPNTLFSLSFLLSFSGVLGIIICYPKINELLIKIPKIIREPLALTLSAQLFVTPITIYSFNTIYLGGIISNLFSLNLSGIIMMLGIVLFIIYLFVPPLVRFPMKLVSFFIFIMNKIAEIFGSIEGLVLYVITPNMLSIFVYYFLLLYIFMKRNPAKANNEKDLAVIRWPNIPICVFQNRRKIVIIILVLIIIISNTKIVDLDKHLNISMIDVGHGDSILLTTPNGKHILVDTGGEYYQGDEKRNLGEQTVAPYLLKKGIRKIDLLILTHMDSDHIGGYESIAKMVDIGAIGISINSDKKEEYKNIKKVAVERLINIKKLKRGDTFYIDDIKFRVLMPQKSEKILEENNDSIVLLVEYKGNKILFMGDLEKEGEKELLALEKELKVDILKVGHHGSITSSSEDFIEAITPKNVLISVGNRFKSIPGKKVLETFDSVGAKVYRTDKMGEINVNIYGKNMDISCQLVDK